MSYLNKNGKMVAVIGSRNFDNRKLVFETLDRNKDRIKCIVSGGASGPDSFAREWCEERGFPIIIFYPRCHDEEGFNRGAGYQRNYCIINRADVVLAFHRENSKGTAHSIEIAREVKKPVKIVDYQSENPPVPQPPPDNGSFTL